MSGKDLSTPLAGLDSNKKLTGPTRTGTVSIPSCRRGKTRVKYHLYSTISAQKQIYTEDPITKYQINSGPIFYNCKLNSHILRKSTNNYITELILFIAGIIVCPHLYIYAAPKCLETNYYKILLYYINKSR